MAKKQKKECKPIGITTDDKKVMENIFMLFDTSGLPLYIIFEQCIDNDMIPSWIHFYEDAIKAGWKVKSILDRLEDSICDTWGYEFWKEVELRLTFWIRNRDKYNLDFTKKEN